MVDFTRMFSRGQPRARVPARWPAMLAASRELRNLAACARACRHVATGRETAWPRIETSLLDVVGWFAADRRLDSSRHWDVAKLQLRRLLTQGATR